MITGSKGTGGRRYQIVAVLLTYAAVSTAAIPVWIHYAGEHKRTTSSQKQASSSTEPGTDSSEVQGAPAKERPAFLVAIGTLVALGLASPFLEFSSDPVGALIGLVILFVGMRFAWRFTAARAPAIFGPFENSPQVPR